MSLERRTSRGLPQGTLCRSRFLLPPSQSPPRGAPPPGSGQGRWRRSSDCALIVLYKCKRCRLALLSSVQPIPDCAGLSCSVASCARARPNVPGWLVGPHPGGFMHGASGCWPGGAQCGAMPHSAGAQSPPRGRWRLPTPPQTPAVTGA